MGALQSGIVTATNAVRTVWTNLVFYKQCLLRGKQEEFDARQADRTYEAKMRFNSEWREREGAVAIYRETGRFGLVRIRSMEPDGHGVRIYLDRVPWPGLPASQGFPLRDSFDVGSPWDNFSVGRQTWKASPYGFTLVFDFETIEAFKATALKFQNLAGPDRWVELRDCLEKWMKKKWLWSCEGRPGTLSELTALFERLAGELPAGTATLDIQEDGHGIETSVELKPANPASASCGVHAHDFVLFSFDFGGFSRWGLEVDRRYREGDKGIVDEVEEMARAVIAGQCEINRGLTWVVGRIHVGDYTYTKITDVPMFSVFPFGKRRYAPYVLPKDK